MIFKNIEICKKENKIALFSPPSNSAHKNLDIFPYNPFSYAFVYITNLTSFCIFKFIHCFVTLCYIETIFLCH